MKNTEAIFLIDNIYNLIKETEKINERSKLIDFIGIDGNMNFNRLIDFYSNFYSVSFSYLYSYINDKEQNIISLKLQEICKWIISNKYIFENSKYYHYIPKELINKISNIEKQQNSNSEVTKLIDELEYKKFKNEIEKITKRNLKKECEKNMIITYKENMFKKILNKLLLLGRRLNEILEKYGHDSAER